jgi:hypothetical protein
MADERKLHWVRGDRVEVGVVSWGFGQLGRMTCVKIVSRCPLRGSPGRGLTGVRGSCSHGR